MSNQTACKGWWETQHLVVQAERYTRLNRLVDSSLDWLDVLQLPAHSLLPQRFSQQSKETLVQWCICVVRRMNGVLKTNRHKDFNGHQDKDLDSLRCSGWRKSSDDLIGRTWHIRNVW